MDLTRRTALKTLAGSLTFALLPTMAARAAARRDDRVSEAITEFTGGVTPVEGGIQITAPEIAENGNTVPIRFAVDIDDPSSVREVRLLADGNPNPGVATFRFSELSARPAAATRIRMAKTQNIIAVAKTNDGRAYIAEKLVKVTIGGCGG